MIPARDYDRKKMSIQLGREFQPGLVKTNIGYLEPHEHQMDNSLKMRTAVDLPNE